MTPEQAKTLAKIDQKLDDLYVNNAREHKEIKDNMVRQNGFKETQVHEYQKMFDSRPKMTLFLWFMAGIFAVMFTIGGFVYHIDVKIEDHLDNARAVYHQLTGKEFVTPFKN